MKKSSSLPMLKYAAIVAAVIIILEVIFLIIGKVTFRQMILPTISMLMLIGLYFYNKYYEAHHKETGKI
ncbi:MAG TPA: hypothetical protein VLZ75_12155 [Chitinophagales bacterium]|nr:hypothetical protein [Chitinophagales bacterium]